MAKTTAGKTVLATIKITLRDDAAGRISVTTEATATALDEDAEPTPAQAEAAALLEWLAQRAEDRGDQNRGDHGSGNDGA